MDQYFERIKNFAANPDLPSRIRFMLQDVVELRANKVSNVFILGFLTWKCNYDHVKSF